jgi:hypothetical protein
MRNEVRGVHGALAGLYEGSWARGHALWPRNPATCASAHASVHDKRGEGGSDKAGPRRRERGKGTRGNGSAIGNVDPQGRERERERTSEGNWRRQACPTGQRARERESERRERASRLAPPGGVRLSGAAGARGAGPGGLDWAEMAFSFPWIF